MARLPRKTVLDIRQRFDLGYPVKEIAEGYGVSPQTVSAIGNRRTHKRVKEGREPPPYPNAPKRQDGSKIERIEERHRRKRRNPVV